MPGMTHAAPSQDLYCKLFVAGAVDDDQLSAAVDAIAPPQGARQASQLDIFVHAQIRHLPLDDTQDDFLLWRHYLDVEAANVQTSFDDFLAELTQLVIGLRAHGWRVVAACDFEDELAAAVRAAGGR